MTEQRRVLIVITPWASPIFPGLGAALLRSVLERDGIGCDILYANLIFSRIINGDPGLETHLAKLPICEIAFTPLYFDTAPADAALYLRDYARGTSGGGDEVHSTERYESLLRSAAQCIDEVMASVDWDRYDVVGFSIMMQQTVASLALAKRIKREHPHIRIVFGGPNCSAPMGEEMVRSFPEVDVAVDGESDGVITQLVREMRAAPTVPIAPFRRDDGIPRLAVDGPYTVPGITFRGVDQNVYTTGPAQPFDDLDSLPNPDYSQFFDQMKSNEITHCQPYLQIETSRGCWWGEKHHCSFCGIDDALMKFRSKTEERVLDEILTLARRHHYTEFFPVDSIINYKFHTTLLPRLGELRESDGYDFSFFFESKSNLRRDQVQMFRYAGVNSIQPGIESFSDHVLRLMDKGTTGVRQIQCLKLLAECGIVANWNLIYRNPNETVEDYREIIDAISYIHHLPPLHGEGLVPMLLVRFSPYHQDPARHGITNVKPVDFYPHVFPDPKINLLRLAFYFAHDHPDRANDELTAVYEELEQAITRWREAYREQSLVQLHGPGFIRIVDRRTDPEKVVTLDGVRAEIFAYCDEVRAVENVIATFAPQLTPAAIETFLGEMVRLRIMYRSKAGQILSLPLLMESAERHQSIGSEELSFAVA